MTAIALLMTTELPQSGACPAAAIAQVTDPKRLHNSSQLIPIRERPAVPGLSMSPLRHYRALEDVMGKPTNAIERKGKPIARADSSFVNFLSQDSLSVSSEPLVTRSLG